jgi:outer membrane protein assembly factor BamB
MNLPCLAALVVLLGQSPSTEDWPQFRGPRGDGTSSASGLPIQWGEERNVVWKTVVPGHGRSSPVILGDRLWLTTAGITAASPEESLVRLSDHPDYRQVVLARRVSLCVVCLDRATGRILYDRGLFAIDQPEPVHRLNSFATPTPVAERATGRVYCDFGTFGTACIEGETGRSVWQTRLAAEHLLGPASSPVLVGDRLIVVRDGCDAQYVAALDKRTGKTLWKTDRPAMETGTRYEKKSFSTPLCFEHGGRTQVLVAGSQWVCCYAPASGEELWRVRHGKGYSLAPRPVFGHGLAFVCTGCTSNELLAIRPDGRGDVSQTHVAWRAKGPIPTMSSPLLVGDELYCVSDNGIVSCFDARSGVLHWRERIGGEQLASPIAAEGRIYCFGWDGKATVLAAGKTFKKLAENALDGPLAATPAAVGRRLYVRTDAALWCLGEAEK